MAKKKRTLGSSLVSTVKNVGIVAISFYALPVLVLWDMIVFELLPPKSFRARIQIRRRTDLRFMSTLLALLFVHVAASGAADPQKPLPYVAMHHPLFIPAA